MPMRSGNALKAKPCKIIAILSKFTTITYTDPQLSVPQVSGYSDYPDYMMTIQLRRMFCYKYAFYYI